MEKKRGRPPGATNKFPSSGKLMDALLGQGFDVLKEFQKLYITSDETNQTKLMTTLLEYVFPKAATTQMINLKSFSEEAGKLQDLDMAKALRDRAAILEEEATQKDEQQ